MPGGPQDQSLARQRQGISAPNGSLCSGRDAVTASVFHNRSDDSHPLHMHRHLFELVELNGKPTAGIMKDTVIVPAFGHAAVDLVANQPGLSLFHCHLQQHMDYGFMALFRTPERGIAWAASRAIQRHW